MKSLPKILSAVGLIILIGLLFRWYNNYQNDKSRKVYAASTQLNWDRNEMDTLIADSAMFAEQMKGVKSWQLLRTEGERAAQIGQQTLRVNKIKSALVQVRQDMIYQQGIIKDNQKSLF